MAISTLCGSTQLLEDVFGKNRRCLSRKLGFKKSDSVSLFPRRLSLSLLGGSSLNEWRRAIESQLQPNRLSLGVAIPQRTRVLANSKILKFQSESPFILHPMSHYAPRTPWIMLKGNWDHKSMALTNFQEYSRLNFLDYD